MYEDYPPGFPFDNFDVAELILPDGDDMGIPSEDEEGDEEQLETETGFGSVIGALGGTDRTPRACIQRCSYCWLPQLWTTCPWCPRRSTRS
jgi:hypothetical protein